MAHDLGMTLPEVLLARELRPLGMRRQLQTWHAKGEVHQIIPGAYVRTSAFRTLGADDRYRLLVIATAHLFPNNQFSHDSAAALWRLPSIGAWPRVVHALAPRSTGGRSKARIVRHGIGLDLAATHIDGVTVTSLSRTLADVATGSRFGRAVAMLDSGLRPSVEGDYRYGLATPTKSDVRDVLDWLGPIPGFARARLALDFADGRSQSAGESLSRVQMHALRLPAPELQVAFYDEAGFIGEVDFYWPALGLIGEFDGHSKYGDARRFARHLTPQEALIAEKEREDRLRAVAQGFVRWNWQTAMDRHALGSLLAARGLMPKR